MWSMWVTANYWPRRSLVLPASPVALVASCSALCRLFDQTSGLYPEHLDDSGGCRCLMILRDPSQTWLLYVYVIFFGIGFGSRAVIFSALTADIFSGKGFGSILGYSTIAVGVGGALGSWGVRSLIGPAAIWFPSRSRRWCWAARM